MGASIEGLQRIGVTFTAIDGAAVAPREIVPVFHRWIQRAAIPDHLLVDVADYAHVPDGPGVLLVAHEGNFNLACTGDPISLTYVRKQPVPGRFAERLRAVTRYAAIACQLLEEESALDGRLRFRADRLTVFSNDRLRAPNRPDTERAFHTEIEDLVGALYGSVACTVTADSDSRERLQLHVRAEGASQDLRTIARRLHPDHR